jgi:hypothetical protein
MTISELLLAIMIALFTSVGGLFLISHSGQVNAMQLGMTRFVTNEPFVRQTLQKSAGMAQRTRVYSTSAGARSGTQSLVSTAGPSVRMDYSGGIYAGGNVSWSATIEFDSTQQQLIYRNVNNSNSWVIADRVTAATFSIVNGVLVLDATMSSKPFSIYTSIN